MGVLDQVRTAVVLTFPGMCGYDEPSRLVSWSSRRSACSGSLGPGWLAVWRCSDLGWEGLALAVVLVGNLVFKVVANGIDRMLSQRELRVEAVRVTACGSPP